jgi:membrane protein DedA with SNARE-associated domain
MLEGLVARWGYLAIVGGTFLEGETILIAAGALAHRGLLSLPLVMVAAFVGSVAGDQLWFFLGRRFGKPLLERRPKWQARLASAQRLLDRYGTGFVAGFRFVYGVRTVTPVLLGVSQYPIAKFALLNALGAALWSVVVGGLGWAIGATLVSMLARAVRIEEALGVALAISLVAYFGWKKLRRRSLLSAR